jgi:hypothetical protein
VSDEKTVPRGTIHDLLDQIPPPGEPVIILSPGTYAQWRELFGYPPEVQGVVIE